MIERLTEALRSFVVERRGPAVLMVLAGIAFLVLAFFDVSTSAVSASESASTPAAVIGATMFAAGVGFLLLDRRDGRKEVRTIVFYAPTFQANSFFASLLDQTVELTNSRGYQLVVERGDDASHRFHEATNYSDVIRRYATPDHVILMVPPNPGAYDAIWALDDVDEARLITLDIGFDEHDRRFRDARFHKRAILSDNRTGSILASQEVVTFCRDSAITAINVIVCEGSMHGRGLMFREAIAGAAAASGVAVTFLGPTTELDFSRAVSVAKRYVTDVMTECAGELHRRPTFVFCANDNLAIGARMAVSTMAPRVESPLQPIRLICFDASVFITLHIDLDDLYIWRAVDQRYQLIVKEAVESADLLFADREPPKEVVTVAPEIYRSG